MKTITSRYSIRTAQDYPNSYYHAPLALYDYDDQVAPISAGTGDDVRLFSEPGYVYIYSGRDSLGYMGLEVYDIAAREITGDVFIDHDQDFAMYEHLQPINRTKAMLQHIY